MPIDNDAPDTIVLGKDLKPGYCVRSTAWSEEKDGNDMGVIVETSMSNERLKKFYGDEPAYSIYDINCPCDGPCSTRLDLEKEFKRINSRKDILYTYRTIEHQILSRAADLMDYRRDLMKIKDDEINRINEELTKLKKQLKEVEK